MRNLPVFSFIVRTYSGRENLLLRALRSIESQRVPYAVEAVVVVDGPEPIEPRVPLPSIARVLPMGKKVGRSNAGNAGLDAAEGQYLNFLDDDDFLYPNHLSTLLGVFEGDPGLHAVYGASLERPCRLNMEDPHASETKDGTVFYRSLGDSIDLITTNYFPIQAVLFRREIMPDFVRLRPELDALEDWLFWQELLIGKRVCGTNVVTSEYMVPFDDEGRARRLEAHAAAEPLLDELRRDARVPLFTLSDTLIRLNKILYPQQL